MADIAKLKKKAAEFESAKKLDKAIAAYREILDLYDSGAEPDIDVALYNRVGDLVMRQGDTAEAVTLYERAVDVYAEGGFFNNAIALCNKILRSSPGRASVYYKLGKISAAKGFKGDAKQNFLEYADRMQKAGNKDEAFRALKEFAEISGDQDDIRLMLADQLLKADRKAEALEQLSSLYDRFTEMGNSAEAEATLERMRAIDPQVEVKSARHSQQIKSNDSLIFLDLDSPTPRKSRLSVQVPKVELPKDAIIHSGEPTEPKPVPASAPSPEILKPVAIDPPTEPVVERPSLLGLPLIDAEPEPTPEPAAVEPLELEPTAIEIEPTTLAGMESTIIDNPPSAASVGGLDGLETTSLAVDDVPDSAPMSAGEFAALEIEEITEIQPVRASGRDLALPGALPLLDIGAEDDGADDTPVDLPLIIPTPIAGIPLVETTSDVSPTLEFIEPDTGAVDLPFIEPAAADDTMPMPEVDAPEAFGEVEVEHVEAPPPPVRRTTSMAIPMLASSIDDLREQVEREPNNWTLRRQLAETSLDEGHRAEGLAMLEEAMAGLEQDGRLHEARSIADELVRLDPESVKHHQKRVEFAFRDDDKAGLATAYVELGDALLRTGHAEKAKAVYQRVLEISHDDLRATAALEALRAATPAIEETPTIPTAPATPPAGTRRYTGVLSTVDEEPATASPADGGDDSFVSLGDWLRDEEGPKNTRMVVEEKEPTGDENADFQDMLRKFKQGVAQNVEEEDHESHYDLGVAYKEMGLLDEAIAEFQKALRGTAKRVRTYEALGQCFLEKAQLPVAQTILQRALHEPGVGDDSLVGVLYLLGYVAEALKKPADAKVYYERVFAVDIQFRDIGDRLNAVESALK